MLIGTILPSNAVGSALGHLQWTPSNYHIGTNYIHMKLTDNNCPYLGISQYLYIIEVVPNNSTNNPPSPVDDYYFIQADSTLVGNLLLNDTDIDGDSIYINSNPIIGPHNGFHIFSSDSTFAYGSPQVGLDSFVYEICDDGNPSMCAQATAYIYVLANPIVPNIIDTLAAGVTSNICFNTANLAYPNQLASITIIDSFSNAFIQNIDVSIGCIKLKADSIATDIAHFQLCDTSGSCVDVYVQLTVEEGVWPGDADYNLVVNNFDLLPIGIGYGNSGTARSNPSIVWNGYLSQDWTQQTPVSQVNYKHLDCDGNGVIDVQDTLAISANWALTYTFNKSSGGGTIPLFIDTLKPASPKLNLPIIFGTSTIPANNVYGLAFTIHYDTSLVKPNSAHIRTDTSWLGTSGIDMISVQKDFYDDGLIQVAVTRTDGINTSGFGRIGSLNFTIQDDIMQRGQLVFPFEISDVKAIDNGEQLVLVNPMQTDLVIETSTNTTSNYLSNVIKVFPNPTSNILNIQSEDEIIEQIILTDMTGKIIYTQNIQQKQIELYMQNIPSGIYILSILTEQGQVQKKVSVLR